MYYLFKYKNILPYDYYCRGEGEKKVIKAFILQEVEERQKTLKEIERAGEL